MVTPQAIRRWVLTGAVTGITILGTIYGADLKSQQQSSQEQKRTAEATPEQILARLETARAEKNMQRNDLEKKLANFRERRREREEQSKEAK